MVLIQRIDDEGGYAILGYTSRTHYLFIISYNQW